ncbi:hypothetical protein BHM03_00056191 [Ensete ventricosum]|nr:hypothetical protein BHM03_00056191 [Ensete ventricosum]
MVSVWRANDSGDEALEVKRRRKVQLEWNNNGGKGREEGMKMRAVAVVAACAAMLAMGEGGKGDSGNDRSDNSGFWGRTMTDSFTTVLVLPTKVASGHGMVLSMTDAAVEEVLGSTSKGRQQRLRRAEGEVEKIAASVWGVTNSGCGYGCYDPRQAIIRLGRQ